MPPRRPRAVEPPRRIHADHAERDASRTRRHAQRHPLPRIDLGSEVLCRCVAVRRWQDLTTPLFSPPAELPHWRGVARPRRRLVRRSIQMTPRVPRHAATAWMSSFDRNVSVVYPPPGCCNEAHERGAFTVEIKPRANGRSRFHRCDDCDAGGRSRLPLIFNRLMTRSVSTERDGREWATEYRPSRR